MENTKEKIDNLITNYYTKYYKDELGLKDYKKRIINRLNEDEDYIKFIDRIKHLFPFFYQPITNQKVLVDGAGTGQEFITLSKMGYDVYAIEPNEEAIEILLLKCEYYNIDKNKVSKAIAESLPFQNNEFDMIWSFTVIEHVQNIKKSIKEIYRTLKPGGWAFLAAPDYTHFYEPHYKIHLPNFMPVFFLKMILIFRGRPTGFIGYGINYVTTKKVRNILQHLKFDSLLLHHHWTDEWQKKRNLRMSLTYWIYRLSGIPRDQWWFVRKRTD